MVSDLSDRVGYCGLICELDSCYGDCGGCKAPGATCGGSDCFQKRCCTEKSLHGCWECDQAPCDDGHFSSSNSSRGQFTGCVRYIKQVGLAAYVDKVRANARRGVTYGIGGDYAGRSEQEVLDLLMQDTHPVDRDSPRQGGRLE